MTPIHATKSRVKIKETKISNFLYYRGIESFSKPLENSLTIRIAMRGAVLLLTVLALAHGSGSAHAELVTLRRQARIAMNVHRDRLSYPQF